MGRSHKRWIDTVKECLKKRGLNVRQAENAQKAIECITDAVLKDLKMGMGRRGVIFHEEGRGREWRLPSLLCANDLVLCDESDEDLRAIVGYVIEVCRRRSLKVNAAKSKVMLIGGEKRLEFEVYRNGICLEHISEFKYFGFALDESGIKDV